VILSAKAMARARERIRELTDRKRNFTPIDQLITGVDRFLKGWGGYVRHGYPREHFDKLNGDVAERLRRHLRRRSQRRYRAPAGRPFYAHLVKDLGLRLL
jgi:RNA-directed DNA polymerase